MATVSFTDIEATPTQEVAIVEAPKATLVTAPSIADASKGLIGDWTASDTKLPRISLCNKSGDLANLFTPGTFVLERAYGLTKLEDKKTGGSLSVIALRMLKQYRENIPFGDETPVRIFNSAAELRSIGGNISWAKGQGTFSEMAHLELLVLAPENLEEDAEALFYNQTANGKRFARVIFTLTGTAYSAVAVPIASSLKGHLAVKGLQGGIWDLSSALTETAKNSWWSPKIKAAGLVDEDTAAMIATLG